MSDTEGAIIPPRKITLGNMLSMGVTLVGVILVIGVDWGTTYTHLATLDDEYKALLVTVTAAPQSYASRDDFNRLQIEADGIVADRKQAQQNLQAQIAALLDKQGATNSAIAGLTATVEGLRDNVTDLKNALRDKQALNVLPSIH